VIVWVFFALGGALGGTAQAGLLARAARGGPSAASALVRLVLAGALLVSAARAGFLAPGAAGWAAGFAAACAVLERRLR
jgi:hypothetical protein